MNHLKGKPHDISIHFRDSCGLVYFNRPKGLKCSKPIEMRLTGDLMLCGIWHLDLEIFDPEEDDAPVYRINFEDILKEINRRMEIIEENEIRTIK